MTGDPTAAAILTAGEDIATALNRLAAAVERLTDPPTDLELQAEAPPCDRCKGRGEFAPGATCTKCGGSGRAALEE